jgi:polyvinyl alcohol dehydrogenase (cytochrome)
MKVRLAAAVLGLMVTSTPVASHAAIAGCAGAADGGEWRSYGATIDNARSQSAPTTLSPSTVGSVAASWKFQTAQAPGTTNPGAFSNTPVVADGCVFLGTDTGWVFALNADTGAFLWKQFLAGGAPGALVGGVIVGSVAVSGGFVYVGVSSNNKPYVAALREDTGAIEWTTTLVTGNSTFINASPVVFNGMILQGIAGYEANADARGAYAILKAGAAADGGGTIMKFNWVIPDDDYAKGYRGASIWSTPAVDAADGYAYAGGGNPASKKLEHRYSNALLKIDVDPSRPTFGQIVDAFKGNNDQYYPGLDRQPVCDMFGDQVVYLAWSAACLQLDLDFGASPNLFRDADGHLIVGDLQKSGIYHAVYADGMEEKWSSVVAPPCFSCNSTSAAFDGSNVYVVGSPPGQLFAMSKDGGRYQWAQPIADGIHYQAVTTANGVVYVMDGQGDLCAFDSTVDPATGLASGKPLLRKPLMADTGTSVSDPGGSEGIAIARNTIYAASSDWIVAYH